MERKSLDVRLLTSQRKRITLKNKSQTLKKNIWVKLRTNDVTQKLRCPQQKSASKHVNGRIQPTTNWNPKIAEYLFDERKWKIDKNVWEVQNLVQEDEGRTQKY